MNKLLILLLSVVFFSCNPSGNKAIIPLEEEPAAVEKAPVEVPKKVEKDTLDTEEKKEVYSM